MWSTAHSIGEGLTFLVVGSLVAWLGWQWGYWGPGLIGIATAHRRLSACSRTGRRRSACRRSTSGRGDQYSEAAEDNAAQHRLALQFSILKIPAIWVLALASATTYVTRYAINSWGILYLQEARGYSLPMAGTLLMISTLAGIVGAVAFGFMSDKFFNARRPPANLLFAMLELVGLGIIFFGPTNTPMLVVGLLLFGMGLTGLVTSLGGLFAVDIAPKRAAGAAMGVIGIFSYIGAAIQEQVSGILIDQQHDDRRRRPDLRFRPGHLVLDRLVGRLDAAGRKPVADEAARLAISEGSNASLVAGHRFLAAGRLRDGSVTRRDSGSSQPGTMSILLFGDHGYDLDYLDEDERLPPRTYEQAVELQRKEWMEDKRPPAEFAPSALVQLPSTGGYVDASGMMPVAKAMTDSLPDRALRCRRDARRQYLSRRPDRRQGRPQRRQALR